MAGPSVPKVLLLRSLKFLTATTLSFLLPRLAACMRHCITTNVINTLPRRRSPRCPSSSPARSRSTMH
ncbi:hypothetical protein EJ08DRAFT_65243 [Tothia fuscella]|uniref:Secreted protein n=1 Tax=Tothia fuscella TaxID=1048955 RepID=A0A9P4NEX6_9PEZI|nr:hypothetical protein EJ08DRAFT_65243 [Tothia fuscella]